MNSELSQEQALVCGQLRNLSPASTTVCSDATGTLAFQKRGGYPQAHREAHRRFLDAGGKLVAVSGDSLNVLRRAILKKLNYRGAGEIFMVTEAGFRIELVRRGRLESLHVGSPVPEESQRKLLAVAEEVISTILRQKFAFSSADYESFFSASGERIDLRGRVPGLEQSSLVERTPAKVTIYFPTDPVSRGTERQILDAFLNDSRVREIAAHEKLHVVGENANFVDVINTSKDEGVTTLLNLSAGRNLIGQAGTRDVVVLGDGPNDFSLFTHPFPGARSVSRFFVGSDAAFVERLRSALPQGAHLQFLPARYIAGTNVVFEALLGEARDSYHS